MAEPLLLLAADWTYSHTQTEDGYSKRYQGRNDNAYRAVNMLTLHAQSNDQILGHSMSNHQKKRQNVNLPSSILFKFGTKVVFNEKIPHYKFLLTTPIAVDLTKFRKNCFLYLIFAIVQYFNLLILNANNSTMHSLIFMKFVLYVF